MPARHRISQLVVLAVTGCAMLALSRSARADENGKVDACVACHSDTTPAIVAQWQESKHAGAGVGCTECHVADAGTPGAKKHAGGSLVNPIVSPRVCGQCHAREEKEFSASHHAGAAQFIGSLDNVLGEMVEGGPAANNGCKQCHGSTMKLAADDGIDPQTWPNSGIGRVNLDGSKGACNACHGRHTFSVAQARDPDTCGKCHMGPDHPQIEIYNESKHGILFRANREKMHLDAESWVASKDYSAAPTCASCHMAATSHQPGTHDVGARISWTLRPPVSTKLENADTRRAAMKDACRQCHAATYIDNFYQQYDSAVTLYNEKYGKPAKEIMDRLYAAKLLTPTPFDEKIEWTYYRLWHHEGRRARHGAAMMGPDYTQWHGFFEVADRFYNEFLPEARPLLPELVDTTLARDEHKWRKGMTAEERQKILDYYQERYGQ